MFICEIQKKKKKFSKNKNEADGHTLKQNRLRQPSKYQVL